MLCIFVCLLLFFASASLSPNQAIQKEQNEVREAILLAFSDWPAHRFLAQFQLQLQGGEVELLGLRAIRWLKTKASLTLEKCNTRQKAQRTHSANSHPLYSPP